MSAEEAGPAGVAPPGIAVPPPGRFAAAARARLGGLPREYWFLWTGTLVNRIGTFVQPFLVLYLTGARGLSPSTAGVLLAVHGVGSIGSHLVGGVLADRIGRRLTMSLGMCAFAASMVFLGFARGLPLLAVGAVLTGVTGELYRPASQALIADVVPPADRARAFGLQFWAINLGFAIATLLAGALATTGYGWLFAGDAATSLLFGLLILRGVGETRPQRAAGHSGDSLLTVLRDRLLLSIIGVWLLYAVVYFQSFSTLPLAMDRDGLGTAAFGLAIAFNGIAIVVVQPIAVGWLERLPRVPTLAVSMLVVGIGFGLTGLADETWQYVLTILVWTLGEIGAATVGWAIVADIAPPHLRGRYSGAFGFSFAGASVLAPLIGTQTFEHAGPPALWAGCAVVGAAAAAVQFAMAPAITRRAETVRARDRPSRGP